jgi:hypothetical protein
VTLRHLPFAVAVLLCAPLGANGASLEVVSAPVIGTISDDHPSLHQRVWDGEELELGERGQGRP